MERSEPERLTLLLVDDTPANLIALKAVLEDPGYRLLTASSGDEALMLALRENIDVVLLDVVMPGLDGFEVARTLKGASRTKDIPILFLTAVATQVSFIYKAYDVGAVDYLVKPLDPNIVRKKVAVFAELVRQRTEIQRHEVELREIQRREYELRIAELRVAGDRRYRKLVDGIDHAIAWTTDESLHLTFISRQASRALGYGSGRSVEPDFWFAHLHPEDREQVLSRFREAVSGAFDLVCSHRLVAADGRNLWFHTGVSGERGVGSAPTELHGFSVDVTDLKRAEEEARRAAQARDDVLAVVSHDLRGPLNSIKLSAGMMGRALANPEESSRAFKYAATILRSAERMESLIGMLLDLAQLEAGGLAVERQAIDLAALVNETLEMLRPIANEKGLQVATDIQRDVIALADRERVLQVISNLIGNAIKFTQEGGAITVRLTRKTDEAQLSISDTGPGIAPEELPHIWQRFWHSKRDGGTGLGLTIAKALVEAQGGRIWVESQVGAGTTFYVALPLQSI